MRAIHVLGVVATVALIQSCGGSSTSTPTPTPTPQPTPPPPIVITQINRTLSPRYFFPNTITTPRAGTLSVQFAWTSAANRMSIGVATSSCTVEAYQQFSCSFLVQDATPSATPTKTLSIANLAAGTYVVIVDNLGPGDESYNYVVTLTPTP